MCGIMLNTGKVLKKIKIRFIPFGLEIQSFAEDRGYKDNLIGICCLYLE